MSHMVTGSPTGDYTFLFLWNNYINVFVLIELNEEHKFVLTT